MRDSTPILFAIAIVVAVNLHSVRGALELPAALEFSRTIVEYAFNTAFWNREHNTLREPLFHEATMSVLRE
jgi:hypothetical protein